MKVLIVSGFLGAGKTTFIKELSERTNKKFVILENEYGSVGIDGDMLEASSTNIWEMTSGCICCSKKGDFAASVLTIANTLDPDYLIIEPTGVGMLSNVISAIQKVEYERIQLLAPITIVDGNSITRYKEDFPDIYKDQIKYTDTVVVSKTVSKSIEEKNKITELLRVENEENQIIFDPNVKAGNDWWQEILKKKYDGTYIEETQLEENYMDNISFSNHTMKSENELIILLEDIIRYRYGNIIRAKGSLKINQNYFQFDLVDRQYSILISDKISKSQVVFIGTDIDKEKLKSKFIEEFMGIKLDF